MNRQWNRRELLAQLAGVSAGFLLPQGNVSASEGLRVAGQDCVAQLTTVSANTIRLSVLPAGPGATSDIASDGSLVRTSWGPPVATIRGTFQTQTIDCGTTKVRIDPSPLTFTITTAEGQTIQQFSVDEETGLVSFLTGDSPLLGLGEGGPQFDRRGS
ncbi:MAG: hypothetical protein WBD19_01720, partial [Candidatus Acidiferrum sp.]